MLLQIGSCALVFDCDDLDNTDCDIIRHICDANNVAPVFGVSVSGFWSFFEIEPGSTSKGEVF